MKFAEIAAHCMEEIKDKVEKENAGKVAPPKLPTPDASRATVQPTPAPLPGGVVPGGKP